VNKVSAIKERIKQFAEKQDVTKEFFYTSIGQTSANFRGDKLFRPIHPDRITKSWARMRTELAINKNIDWYSLKDSGITDLLRAGVPLISVRDQARHYSSAQTDTYTPKDLKVADKNIQKSSVKFLN
jgi:hypothetical protein